MHYIVPQLVRQLTQVKSAGANPLFEPILPNQTFDTSQMSSWHPMDAIDKVKALGGGARDALISKADKLTDDPLAGHMANRAIGGGIVGGLTGGVTGGGIGHAITDGLKGRFANKIHHGVTGLSALLGALGLGRLGAGLGATTAAKSHELAQKQKFMSMLRQIIPRDAMGKMPPYIHKQLHAPVDEDLKPGNIAQALSKYIPGDVAAGELPEAVKRLTPIKMASIRMQLTHR